MDEILTVFPQGYSSSEESLSEPHARHCESVPERDPAAGTTRVSEGKSQDQENIKCSLRLFYKLSFENMNIEHLLEFLLRKSFV